MVAGFESFKNWFQGYEQVDSKNIRKHKNDVFRLSALLNQNIRVELSNEIREDVKSFLDSMAGEQIDVKQLGLSGYNKESLMKWIQRYARLK